MRLLNEALLRVMATFEGMRPRREEGQTLVEYALIIALISIAAIAVMVTAGRQDRQHLHHRHRPSSLGAVARITSGWARPAGPAHPGLLYSSEQGDEMFSGFA